MLYLVLALPLGVLAFTVAVVLLSVSLGFVVAPFAQMTFGIPVMTFGSVEWFAPWWAFPFFWVVAAAANLVLLHTAKLFAKAKIGMARVLLVADPA